ncbi:MAG: SDR family NAD(P)-dependent oxidoreductase, partial [Halomonas venusta]|nr:SDR family NAD(P)-dependent oxidoreductase [Halomonas venusta]
MQVKDCTFLITGAASGLGAATAERLIAAGGSVVLCDMNNSVLEHAKRLGDRAVACIVDITSAEQMQQAIDEAIALGGESGLSGVIHCAGVVSVAKLVDRNGNPADLESYAKTININLVGTFNVMRLAAAAMAKNTPNESGERGVIINTASIAAFDGQVGQCAYSASKAGVVGMSLPAAR